MTSPSQLRAARAILDITQAQLATRIGVSAKTIKRAESDSAIGVVSDDTIARIRALLEAGGIEFIAENGGGPQHGL